MYEASISVVTANRLGVIQVKFNAPFGAAQMVEEVDGNTFYVQIIT